MFEFGFSYIGLIFLIMLFVPNILWSKNKPADYEKYASNENRKLLLLERAGEALTTVCALIFKSNNIRINSIWLGWLILAFIFMIIYEIYWLRYFKSSKTMKDMYSSCFGIRVAGASCPVIAFFLMGIYGSNIFLILSAIILGVGHIGIHLDHEEEACGKRIKSGKGKIALRIIAIILLLPVVAVIAVRNFNLITNPAKINETLYLDINGQEQYINIRSTDINNPVILYLHGGPGNSDTPMSYVFSDYLVDDYTVVCWDQRGCGRTYFRNDDKNNSTLSFEMAISDMEVLTSYLKERFSQEKIIIMGHSYGSVLGSAYAYEHPEDCEAFIGVGQFVNFKAASMAAYDVAYQRAKEAGDDTMSMTVAYNTLVYAYSMPARMNLNRYILPYLDSQYHGYTLPDVLFSPYMNSEDFMWTTKTLYYESYMEYEGSLVDHLNYLDLRTEQTSYEVPVMFISGGCDYNCTYTLAEEYASVCGAQIYIIEGADHNCHAACPEEFSQAVKNFLTGL